ncbi:hypothetical protein JD969_05820 [Planctomycetota bacterium]|nr:hypothetical protein JD969_05820 [Planctomycetota bacterium]
MGMSVGLWMMRWIEVERWEMAENEEYEIRKITARRRKPRGLGGALKEEG